MNMKSAKDLNFRLQNEYSIQAERNIIFDYSDSQIYNIKETVLDSGKIVADRLWTEQEDNF